MNKKHLILFCCSVFIVSITFSKYLLSISMFGLAIAALIRFEIGKGRSYFRPDWESIGRLFRAYRYPSFMALSLFFFIVFFSVLQGGDTGYWLERVRIKLPFLVIPLMFVMFPRFTDAELNGLHTFLLGVLFITCAGIGINYLLYAETINQLMLQGQPMPTPLNHIRFSLLLAYGILCGGYLYWKDPFPQYRWSRGAILGVTIFLFFFIHFLSVRSGLFALYVALPVLAGYYAVRTKRYFALVVVFLLLVIMPVAGYHLVPSFRAKIRYVNYDFWKFQRGEGAEYADAGRIVSIRTGYEIFREHPIVGIGVGNMKEKVAGVFAEKYADFPNPLMPHNQFLYVAAGTGLVGLLGFLIGFLFPLFYRRNYRHPLLLGLYAIFFAAFMIEHTIENSIGVGFYCFFLLLLLSNLNKDSG